MELEHYLLQIAFGKCKCKTMTTKNLLDEIEMALDLHNISATKFGYTVAGDPALVPKMRKGRRAGERMRIKIEAALKTLSQEGKLR